MQRPSAGATALSGLYPGHAPDKRRRPARGRSSPTIGPLPPPSS